MKKLAMLGMVLALAGCKSAADRMYACEAQGISKDACYMAEQNRQSGINAAAEKQAMENAANAVQHAQSAHAKKPARIHVNKFGVDFRRDPDGIAYINGSPAANDENNQYASVYSGGLITVIVYKTGKINAMEDGKFLGRLK